MMTTLPLIVALAAPPVITREAAPAEVEPAAPSSTSGSPSSGSATSSSSGSAQATVRAEETTTTTASEAGGAGASEASGEREADKARDETTKTDAPARRRAAPTPPPQPDAPIRPLRWRVDIGVGAGMAIFTDPAWRAFDLGNRRIRAFDLGVRGDLHLGSGRLFLGFGAGYRQFSERGVLDQTVSTAIVVREPIVALRLSAVMVEGVDVFGQLAGGPSFVAFTLVGPPSGDGKAVRGFVDGLAGVTLYLPRRWLPRRGAERVTGGLELAAGYSFRPAVDVDAALATGEEPIDGAPASFGDVAMRGASGRVGIFLRVF